MRVAIDTTYAALGPSGTGVYIERLIPALEAEGVEVVRLREPLRTKRGGRNKLRSAANAALDIAWLRELLPKAAERAKADVLHHPLPAWSPTTRMPQVITVHDVAFARHPEDFDPAWRRIAMRTHRKAAEHADAIVAVSATTARDAAAWLRAPVERIVIARHGAGQELGSGARGGELSPERGSGARGGELIPERGSGEPGQAPDMRKRRAEHWLYVGDDEPRKNVQALRDAHVRYRADGGALPLVLAGAAGVPADAQTLAGLHARAIALVHPSRDEGFGLTVLEAMSVGTPVIAVRNAAIEELAGEAALIVDEPELADAMQRVERDERLRNALSEAGRRRAAEFSWQRSAKAHIQAYTLARSFR